jgi:hypothetical protein
MHFLFAGSCIQYLVPHSENRFGAQAPWCLFLNFLKSIKYFQKKYLRVDNKTHYHSTNFYWKILYILDAAKKTKLTKTENTVAHSKSHCLRTDL